MYFKRWLPVSMICGEINQSLLDTELENILAVSFPSAGLVA
ncbi:hypothetical protein FEDK69T_27320 [Flavobacterium enshiense DK69]|nr:hypothetical protein FEDK69T_27320 [Flavobacterium enshiense DK69]